MVISMRSIRFRNGNENEVIFAASPDDQNYVNDIFTRLLDIFAGGRYSMF